MTIKAKLLLFILTSKVQSSEGLYSRLEKSFSKIDFKGSRLAFEVTDYYADEFGEGLHRQIISFQTLVDPSELPAYKKVCKQVEDEFLRDNQRVYNLDIGYMDTDKVVLGSFKWGGTKLYLGQGVYGDMLLTFSKRAFWPTEWAFEDFKDVRYHKDLKVVREKLKASLRRERNLNL